MRLIRTFGLAAIAATAAMAFVGAPSASATNTQVCKVHTGLTCPAGQASTGYHMVNEGIVGVLTSFGNVLCLNALGSFEPLALGSPQSVHMTALTFTGCGTNAAHNNCVVTVKILPLLDILKTGLNQMRWKALTGRINAVCSGLVDCEFDISETESENEGEEMSAEELEIVGVGGALCPANAFVHFRLQALAATPVYYLG